MESLTAPQPAENIPPVLDMASRAAGLVSPSGFLAEAVALMCGTNPVEYVVEKATGDWEAVSKAGDALFKLADFTSSFGSAVGDGKEAMLAGWTGEAATAAGRYFDTIPAALAGQLEALRGAGQGCQDIASGMKSSLDIIVGILELIMDLAIAAAIDLAMGASLSWTGIGGAAAIAAAMAIVALGAAEWIKVLSLLDEMFQACSIFAGVAQGLSAQIGDMRDLPLPAGSYDNPQV